MYIDACDPKTSSWTRYINCCREDESPNVGFYQGPESHESTVYIVALSNIKANEELRVDYGSTYRWEEPRY